MSSDDSESAYRFEFAALDGGKLPLTTWLGATAKNSWSGSAAVSSLV